MTIDEFLCRLGKVQGSGDGFVAQCPAHDDQKPSLSVGWKDGRILVKCHAGCATEDIVRAMGLTIRDLFDDASNLARARRKHPSETSRAGETRMSNGDCCEVIATYIYEDADGMPRHYVDRTSSKGFIQGRIVDGKKVKGLNGEKVGLYHLPEIMTAPIDQPVYIAEGEKDVDRLRKEGLLATCNPGGAEKFRTDHAEALKGRPCVLVMDRDAAGEKHARKVFALLTGQAASVRVVQAKTGKDAFDHFEAGHGVADFVPVKLEVEQDQPKVFASGIRLQSLGEMLNAPPEEIEWLVEGLLVMGGTSLTVAKPKVGKSTLLRHLAFCVARGLPFLGREVALGPVIYVALEEKKSEIVKQFRAMGGTDDDQIYIHVGSVVGEALNELARVIKEHSPVLVIIDPLFKMVRVPDANDYAKVTAALEPVTEFARQAGVHIALCHHRGKGEREDGDAVLGSTAIFGAVDTLVTMSKRSDRRVVSSTNRYGEDLEELILTLDKDTYLVKCGGTLEQIQVEEKLADIIALLEQEPELSENDLRGRIGGNTGLIPRALRRGLDVNQIERSGAGKRGSPYVYRVANGFPFPVSLLSDQQENEKTRVVEVVV